MHILQQGLLLNCYLNDNFNGLQIPPSIDLGVQSPTPSNLLLFSHSNPASLQVFF